jgi:DNA-binding MarR family transcriptional regulator
MHPRALESRYLCFLAKAVREGEMSNLEFLLFAGQMMARYLVSINRKTNAEKQHIVSLAAHWLKVYAFPRQFLLSTLSVKQKVYYTLLSKLDTKNYVSVRITDLTEKLHLEKAHLYRTLAELVGEGFLEKEPHKQSSYRLKKRL